MNTLYFILFFHYISIFLKKYSLYSEFYKFITLYNAQKNQTKNLDYLLNYHYILVNN